MINNKKEKPMIKKERNIFQKLLEVRKSVPYIKKGTKGYGYNYTSESQVLGAIRSKMDSEGLWLDMTMLGLELAEISVYVPKDKRYINVSGVRAKFEFTWTNCDNPDETIVKHQILQDAGSDVKIIGGLETYATKYFLFKFFNIPNDDLDPDKFEKAIEISMPVKEKDNGYITPEQVHELSKILVNIPTENYKKLLKTINVNAFSEIPREKYEKAVKYIENHIKIHVNGKQNEENKQ